MVNYLMGRELTEFRKQFCSCERSTTLRSSPLPSALTFKAQTPVKAIMAEQSFQQQRPWPFLSDPSLATTNIGIVSRKKSKNVLSL